MSSIKRKPDLSKLLSEVQDIGRKVQGYFDYWEFQQFLSVLLLYRFISNKISSNLNEKEGKTGRRNFNYAALSDEEAQSYQNSVLEELGLFIPPTELFENVCERAADEKNLCESLKNILQRIEETVQGKEGENTLKGLFDVLTSKDNQPNEEVNEMLAELLNAIDRLPLESSSDFFKLLIRNYADRLGYKGNLVYTPQEVSELLARLTVVGKEKVDKVYDPACGSGSLLVKFVEVIGEENIKGGVFGQELYNSTFNFCRINMFLQNLNFCQFDITIGDTLTSPFHKKEQPFDAIVSNPPYTRKWEGSANPQLASDERFTPAGVLAPRSSSDFAYFMHSLSWLDKNGTAAIVSYPGVMYRNGREQQIRKYLVENNFVDAVIHLPEKLFVGTTSAFCVLVLKKNKPDTKVLFINAAKEFAPGSGKNKLNIQHIDKILNCYMNRKDYDFFSKLVDIKEIEAKNYDISVRSYVTPKYMRENPKIKELNSEVKAIVSRQNELRVQIDEYIADFEGVAA